MAWKYRRASGAIPLMLPEEFVPSPRTEPATWVPCPSMSAAPSSAGEPQLEASDALIPHETTSTMWSLKSACMVESLVPLSRPVSATVTMIPVPSTLFHELLMPLTMVWSQRSSALRMVSATSFCNSAHIFSSIHSISSCSANHARAEDALSM